MRPFLIALGSLWFVLSGVISYGMSVRSHPGPARILVQPGALKLPPPPVQPSAAEPDAAPIPDAFPIPDSELAPEPVAEPAPAVVERPLAPPPEALQPAPVRQPALPPAYHAPDIAPEPPPDRVSGARETRRSKTPRLREPGALAPSSVEGPGAAQEPVARCMVCGEAAGSWVELEGQRIGYCAVHAGTPSPAVSGRARAAGTAEGGPAASGPGEAGSAQCRGVTKSGSRCRRKTKDASGLCYQHRR
jgi:hypothetical protein